VEKITKSQNVVMTPSIEYWVERLQSVVEFPIHITSGYRTPEAQVRAMFKKIELGDNLLNIYKDKTFAQNIMNAYPDTNKAIQIVSEYASKGGGSKHLQGLAFDLRTRDKTPVQIEAMKQGALALGLLPLVESTPPHIHIGIPKELEKKSRWNIGVIAGLALLWVVMK
jgi:hypothetical protein